MGNAKAGQTPTKDRKLGLMDRVKNLLPKKQADKATKDTAQNFIDHVEKADENLNSMLQSKEADVDKETGKEKVNTQKVAILHTQMHHLEEIARLAHQYQDL